MLARIPVIIIGIPAVYGLLVAAGDEVRLLCLALVCYIGQYELKHILAKEESSLPWPEWLGATAILAAAHFFGERGLLTAFAGSGIFLVMVAVLRGLQGNNSQQFMRGLFSLFYLPFCLACYLLLAKVSGGMTLFVILASIWALDIGAFIFGMTFRGPKLAPGISPNKTISGAVGGALCCIAFVLGSGHFALLSLPQPRLIILAISIAIIGQIADLFESVLKRESQTKDSGSLMGAHGGLLDRIDSVLFIGPLCYALLVF